MMDVEDGREGNLAIGTLVNWAGAAVSVGLVAGLCVWGVKLIQRDITGVPVIKPLAGDSRVLPEDPGGQLATNTGLAVNEVQAAGTAAPAADRLVLAPALIDVIEADTPVIAEGSAISVSAPATLENETALVAASVQTDNRIQPSTTADILALADSLTNDVEPVLTSAATDRIATSVPGVKRSYLPAPRPSGLSAVSGAIRTASLVTATDAAPVAATPTVTEVASVPAGTHLVQLGAYDSAETARTEWSRITGKFEEYFDGKSRLVQEATSGGRQFFRLRATGFADINDARRFCATLQSENTACIPVVFQ